MATGKLPKKTPALSKDGDASTTLPKDHAFVGMWKDREDMKDPVAYIRRMSEPRYTGDKLVSYGPNGRIHPILTCRVLCYPDAVQID